MARRRLSALSAAAAPRRSCRSRLMSVSILVAVQGPGNARKGRGNSGDSHARFFIFFWSGRHPFRRRGAEGGGLSARRGWDAGWRTSGAAIFLHTSWAGLLMGMDLAALLLTVHLGHYALVPYLQSTESGARALACRPPCRSQGVHHTGVDCVTPRVSGTKSGLHPAVGLRLRLFDPHVYVVARAVARARARASACACGLDSGRAGSCGPGRERQ